VRKLFAVTKQELVKKSKNGISMEIRLIIFFLVFLVTIMFSISLILYIIGVFNIGMKENTALFEKELSHISKDIYNEFGYLSLRSVSLSKQVSKSIELILKKHNIKPSELYGHPELLEKILSAEFDKLIAALQEPERSGVFLILNATVNPGIAGAENSKAGLFLKNMEPNAINLAGQDIRYMRGPASIGRNNKMTFLPQWTMEFDISNADYFTTPIQTARESNLPLSRQYYWCSQPSVDGYNKAMLCSTPMIASDGTVFGVVGFEVSSMMFKLRYSPYISVQNRIFCMLAPSDGTYLYMKNAMFAGNYSVSEVIPTTQTKMCRIKNQLSRYICNETGVYCGIDSSLRLYADDSPYQQEQWSVVLLVPEADMNQLIARYNRPIILLLILLTATCAILSILISRKYLQPVKRAFDTIKSQNITEHKKTRIPEIDDLLEYLAQQDERASAELHGTAKDSAAHSTAMFESFMENIKTLSMAEKAVFDLYLKKHTAKEIAEILCLSINTIKTHNKRIYMKLNVSSRKELMVYIQMMQELKQTKGSGGV
jgi:DNA-binding CsgD family transcriptional regulator